MFLVLVAAVPLAGLFWAFLRARREKSLDRLVAPSLRTKLMPAGVNLWGLQAWLVLAGLFLCLFAASRPQWGKTTEKTVERSRFCTDRRTAKALIIKSLYWVTTDRSHPAE